MKKGVNKDFDRKIKIGLMFLKIDFSKSITFYFLIFLKCENPQPWRRFFQYAHDSKIQKFYILELTFYTDGSYRLSEEGH